MVEEVERTRSVLIAGGGRGIGRACAEVLAAEGFQVLITDPGVGLDGSSSRASIAEEVAADIRRSGGKAVGSPLGIGDIAQGAEIVSWALSQVEAIDAVVVPAMVLRDRMMYNLTQEDWDSVIRVNLTGVFGLLRAVIPVMRQEGYGRIVTFTSGAGIEGRTGTSNYAAAKMGVVGFTKSVAKEVSRYGILVNCIAPRAQTRASDHVARERSPEGEHLDYRELGLPEDVARIAAFLLSDSCRVTGRVFTVSGNAVGVYPEFRSVTLFDGTTPVRVQELNDRVAAVDKK